MMHQINAIPSIHPQTRPHVKRDVECTHACMIANTFSANHDFQKKKWWNCIRLSSEDVVLFVPMLGGLFGRASARFLGLLKFGPRLGYALPKAIIHQRPYWLAGHIPLVSDHALINYHYVWWFNCCFKSAKMQEQHERPTKEAYTECPAHGLGACLICSWYLLGKR